MNNKEEPGGAKYDESLGDSESVNPLPRFRNLIRYLDLSLHSICKRGLAVSCGVDFSDGKLFQPLSDR